jgi:replication-associated recombination protein RarA
MLANCSYTCDAVGRVGIPEDQIALAYLGVDAVRLRASVSTSRAEKRAELESVDRKVATAKIPGVLSWKGQHALGKALAVFRPG